MGNMNLFFDGVSCHFCRLSLSSFTSFALICTFDRVCSPWHTSPFVFRCPMLRWAARKCHAWVRMPTSHQHNIGQAHPDQESRAVFESLRNDMVWNAWRVLPKRSKKVWKGYHRLPSESLRANPSSPMMQRHIVDEAMPRIHRITGTPSAKTFICI